MPRTKLPFPPRISADTFLSRIKVSLFLAGFDIKQGPFRDPYLKLQYRRSGVGWTSIYHGLTSAAKQPRLWFTLTGPEEGLLVDLLAAEDADKLAELTPLP